MTESKATNKRLKREIREFGKRREKETKKQETFRLKKKIENQLN